ncbi:hypothetical protein GCM10011352_12860 [Marinobacterium zhoushanense]|uniref:SprA-related family protein n=1 Tax=Marinobacterium zhoushanense TaxID=1679163 RepID=A0ABQ1K921_9GAMM|nr:putative metalloprotease CJM1_0395 family protein [Marinobacterium zhoushanense]GGB88286.1 hypothetical protein GCM10011352_12860 [Marinobacterium zhoushanense]
MISAISAANTAYTTLTPGNRGAEAANLDERTRAQRAALPAVGAGTQPSDSRSSVNDGASSGLRGEQRVSGSQRSSDIDQQEIDKLEARDREVRAHERAHQSAGGGLAGSASFTYQRGPDGKQYAIGGEVSIAAPVSSGDPEADLDKAQVILRAALAPVDPSGQDLKVAAAARALISEAQVELATQAGEAGNEETEEGEQPAVLAENRGAVEQESPVRQAEGSPPEDFGQSDTLVSLSAPPAGVPAEDEASTIGAYEQRLAESEERRAAFEEQQREREQRAEQLAEYQQEMAQLQQRLAEINQKFVQSGALDIQYLAGSFIDAQA